MVCLQTTYCATAAAAVIISRRTDEEAFGSKMLDKCTKETRVGPHIQTPNTGLV